MRAAPQIPFDFYAPEAPSLDNFVTGANAELLARLRTLAAPRGLDDPAVISLWGGSRVGKTHLLAAQAADMASRGVPLQTLNANDAFPEDPFVTARLLCVDDADELNATQSAWLFTAFNHVAQNGGVTVVSGKSPPGTWPLRDDLRTRMASGLIFEVLPIPQDELAPVLAEYAKRRGFSPSEEVLAYLLSRSRRDITTLCQVLSAIDRLSLAQKRAVTVPLLREYLKQAANESELE